MRLDTVAVQRPVILSVRHLKSKAGDQQWRHQEDDNLGSTDVGDLEKQRVRGRRCRATRTLLETLTTKNQKAPRVNVQG